MAIKYDPKISAGHVITIIGLLLSMSAAYFGIKAEVASVSHAAELRTQELQHQIQTNTQLQQLLMGRVTNLEDWRLEGGS